MTSGPLPKGFQRWNVQAPISINSGSIETQNGATSLCAITKPLRRILPDFGRQRWQRTDLPPTSLRVRWTKRVTGVTQSSWEVILIIEGKVEDEQIDH